MNAAAEVVQIRKPRTPFKPAPKNLDAVARFYYQAGRAAAHRDEVMVKARRENDRVWRSSLVESARFHNRVAINFLSMAREMVALRAMRLS